MDTSQFVRLTSVLRLRRPGMVTVVVTAMVFLLSLATAQESQTVRFAAIGDFGKVRPEAQAVATRIAQLDPDFIITLGDNNYEYGGADTIDANIGQYYHAFISPYLGSYGAGASVNRFFPSLGNHDWGDGYVWPARVTPYTDFFALPGNERYYDFTSGAVHLFSLSSDGFEPDGNTSTSVQANWLQQRLAASTSRWKIAYFHNPPYSSSAHANGIEEAHMRQWPLRQWGVTAALAGHHHTYERLTVENTPYLVNGLGGHGKDNFTFPLAESNVRYNGDYGAVLVTASPSRITFEFITRTGVTVDSYSIDAPAAAGAPYNLVATPVPTGRIDLWWSDDSPSEAGFSIERSDDGSSFVEINRVDANVTGYSDNTLSPTPTTYRYRVRAFSAQAEMSAYSNIVAATTAPEPPAAPVLTGVAPNSSSIDLTWTAVGGADGVRVYRLNGQTYTFISEFDPGVTTFTDNNRVASTAYTYVVRAFNPGGESPSSNVVSVTTNERMTAPQGLTATGVSSSQIDLAWLDTTDGEDGFKIFRSTDGISFGTLAWVGPNVTTYSNTGRPPETTYYYYVRAYEATGGESLSSNTASATTLAPLPAPSNLTAAAVSTSRIDLVWQDNSTTEGAFRIYRSTDGVNFSFTNQTSADATSFSITGLTPATTYYFRVTAKETAGNESSPSNTASAATMGLADGPTNLVATAVSSSQIDLSWTDNSASESGFRIDRSLNGTSFSTLTWVGANVTTFSNTGREPNTTYYYRVSAYDSGGSSAFSNVASATTAGALGAPSNLQATAVTSTRVDLAWTDNSTSETGFKVYRSTDGTNYTFLGNAAANATSYTNNSAQASTTYYYRVLAYEPGGGQSAYSNVATVTTPGVPTPPSNLTATAISSTAIALAWADGSNNEQGFRIERSTNGNSFSTLAWVGPNITTYTNTGRSPGTTYWYRVRSYNANGTSEPSNVASATTP